jgi:hypothetical protein
VQGAAANPSATIEAPGDTQLLARPRSSLPAAARAIVDRLETDFPNSAESLFACGEILELFGQSDEAPTSKSAWSITSAVSSTRR